MIRKKSSLGFSIVELMIVAGALGGLSLVVMNLSKQSSKATVKYQFDSEINLITSEINAILSNPDRCKLIFETNKLTPNNINGKYFTTASGSAPVSGYGNSGVKITSYTLEHSTLPGATANDGILTILFQNKAIVGGSTTPRKINMYYEGPITAITECRSLSSSSTDIWSHGTGADIYYIGNVGIGTSTPSASLDIVAPNLGNNVNDSVEIQRFDSGNGNSNFLDVRNIRTSAGTSWYSAGTRIQEKIDATWMGYVQFNGAGNDGGVSFGTGLTTVAPGNVTEQMRIDASGNVGVGTPSPVVKLDVAGGLKVGDQTQVTVCNATTEGTQRYNKTLHAMEYCGASGSPLTYAWTGMGGGGGAPTGMVAFFMAATCPSGWVAANGTGGTVDMRGEFVRGLDSGRNVDTGRALGSFQAATGIGYWVYQGAYLHYQNEDSMSAPGAGISRGGVAGYVSGQQFFTTRPRNIALLACQAL